MGGQAQRGNQGRVNPAAIAQSRLVTPCLQNGRDGGGEQMRSSCPWCEVPPAKHHVMTNQPTLHHTQPSITTTPTHAMSPPCHPSSPRTALTRPSSSTV